MSLSAVTSIVWPELAAAQQSGIEANIPPYIEFRVNKKTVILEGYGLVPEQLDNEIKIDPTTLPAPANWDSSLICRHDIPVLSLHSSLVNSLLLKKVKIAIDRATDEFFNVITIGNIVQSKFVFYNFSFKKMPRGNMIHFKYSASKVISDFRNDESGRIIVSNVNRLVQNDDISEQMRTLAIRALSKCQ